MNHRIQSDYSRDTTAASATSTSSHANLFFFSAGSSSSSSQAFAAQDKRTYENDVTVAFRATLVTVDRAGWFQPQFFKQSGSFYHIDPSVSWSRSVNGSQALLPTFPVGYVLCKVYVSISYVRHVAEPSLSGHHDQDPPDKVSGHSCKSEHGEERLCLWWYSLFLVFRQQLELGIGQLLQLPAMLRWLRHSHPGSTGTFSVIIVETIH